MKEKNLKKSEMKSIDKSVLTETDAMRRKLVSGRDAKVEELEKDVTTAEKKIKAAEDRAAAAKAALDFTAFDAAVMDKQHAEMERDSYSAKLEKVKAAELIPEKDSDQVVKNVLAYKKKIDDDLLKNIAAHFVEIQKLFSEYENDIQSVSDVLQRWTSQVHGYIGQKAYDASGNLIDSRPDSFRFHDLVPRTVKSCKRDIQDVLIDNKALRDQVKAETADHE